MFNRYPNLLFFVAVEYDACKSILQCSKLSLAHLTTKCTVLVFCAFYYLTGVTGAISCRRVTYLFLKVFLVEIFSHVIWNITMLLCWSWSNILLHHVEEWWIVLSWSQEPSIFSCRVIYLFFLSFHCWYLFSWNINHAVMLILY